MKKRILAMVMAVVMAVSLLPVSALATETQFPAELQKEKQIEGNYYTYDASSKAFGTTGNQDAVVKNNNTNDPKVTISKTIEPTGTENQFDITLQVVTKEAIEETVTSPALAVTLVMDISGSMTSCVDCNSYHCNSPEHKNRIEKAKEAAEAFLNTYAGFDNGTFTDPGAARYVSLVVFDGDEETKTLNGDQVWLDLHAAPSSNQTQREATEAQLDKLFGTNGEISKLDTGKGTNIDGGLKNAEEVLGNAPENTTKFLVLLTDGQPSAHESFAPSGEGYELPSSYPNGNQHFNNYNSEDYTYPAKRAMYIRNELDTTFYSINLLAGDSVSTWLSSFSDKSVAANNGDELDTAFEEILIRMALSVDAWKVTDPMGDYIKYVNYEGSHSSGSITAPSSGNNNTLTWDLRKDLFSESTTIIGEDGTEITEETYQVGAAYTITYTLKYQISLDVAAMLEGEQIVSAEDNSLEYVLTNKATKLDYYLTKTTDDGDTVYVNDEEEELGDGDEKLLTMYFKVPKVRGYAGELSFTKVDEKNVPLAGATFTLTGTNGFSESGTSVAVEEGAETNKNVTISGIPSGATYTLKETGVPEGYQDNNKEYTVEVNYGVVTLKEGSEEITAIQNTPTTGSLIVTKTVNGLDTLPANFAISVTKGNTEVQSLTVSGATRAENVYTWTLPNVAPGTYSVTESNYVVDGYHVEKIGDGSNATVVAGQEARLNLTNTYTAKVANTSITKTADKADKVYAPGETVEYTVTLTNSGNINDTVTVVDTLPAALVGTNNITITAGTGTVDYANHKITWNETVSSGETTTLTYKVVIPENVTLGDHKNTAIIGDGTAQGKKAEETITVKAAKLSATKEAPPTVVAGGELTYTITVTNEGNKAAEGVVITDKIPDGLEFVSATDSGSYNNGTVTWNIASIGAANAADNTDQKMVSVTVKVPKAAENGTKYENTAVVNGKDTNKTVTVVDNLSASIGGTKVVKKGGNVAAPTTEQFTFTLTQKTGEGVAPYTETVTAGAGAFTFSPIKYTEPGTYVYEVSETAGTAANWTYDDSVYTVTVVVSRDNDGKLAASAPVYAVDGKAAEGISFTNTYTKNQSSKPSTDIPDNPPALNNVDHYAYIIGYPDGNVKPAGNITRAEVATIFFRLLTDESRSLFWSTENAYSDVSADQWFNNAISTLSNAGIINGYEDGTFRPNAPITRAEFAKIAASFFTYAEKEYQGLYPDVPETKWYALFVEAASELGLITGYPDGTFRPDQLITRAEACTIVNRTIERKPHEDQLHQDMILWPDNPAPGEVGHEWYYEQVQEATNSHEYEMKNEYENWTEILENRDWAALEQEWSDANSAPGPDVMK